MVFMGAVMEYYELSNNEWGKRLPIRKQFEGEAADWMSAHFKQWTKFDDLKEQFKNRFWSEEEQKGYEGRFWKGL